MAIDLDERRLKLNSYEGVVRFWFTGCAYFRQECGSDSKCGSGPVVDLGQASSVYTYSNGIRYLRHLRSFRVRNDRRASLALAEGHPAVVDSFGGMTSSRIMTAVDVMVAPMLVERRPQIVILCFHGFPSAPWLSN